MKKREEPHPAVPQPAVRKQQQMHTAAQERLGVRAVVLDRKEAVAQSVLQLPWATPERRGPTARGGGLSEALRPRHYELGGGWHWVTGPGGGMVNKAKRMVKTATASKHHWRQGGPKLAQGQVKKTALP